jgi:hypothetical protein
MKPCHFPYTRHHSLSHGSSSWGGRNQASRRAVGRKSERDGVLSLKYDRSDGHFNLPFAGGCAPVTAKAWDAGWHDAQALFVLAEQGAGETATIGPQVCVALVVFLQLSLVLLTVRQQHDEGGRRRGSLG